MDLEGLLRPVAETIGLELVEVALVREQGRRVLRVTVDREGGVDLDAIAGASERISRRLDLEGYDPGRYELEVSSPGVERPLRGPDDFARRVGETVRLKMLDPAEGSRSLSGVIVAATPDEVRVATEAGERSVAYRDIASARTVYDWEADLRGHSRRRSKTEAGGRR